MKKGRQKNQRGGVPRARARVIEQAIRQLSAGVWVTVSPGSAHWARTRAEELACEGRDFDVVLVWGGQRFRAGEQLFGGAPYLAFELDDGSLESSPWAPPEAALGSKGTRRGNAGTKVTRSKGPQATVNRKGNGSRRLPPSDPLAQGPTGHTAIPLRQLERHAIWRVLHATQGRVTEAAKLLGIGRATLYRRLAELQATPSNARNAKRR